MNTIIKLLLTRIFLATTNWGEFFSYDRKLLKYYNIYTQLKNHHTSFNILLNKSNETLTYTIHLKNN